MPCTFMPVDCIALFEVGERIGDDVKGRAFLVERQTTDDAVQNVGTDTRPIGALAIVEVFWHATVLVSTDLAKVSTWLPEERSPRNGERLRHSDGIGRAESPSSVAPFLGVLNVAIVAIALLTKALGAMLALGMARSG